MDFLREWMRSVFAAALALSLLRAMMPKGTVRKVGELAIGLVLLLVILQPVQEIVPDWLSQSGAWYAEQASAYPDDLTLTNESYLESVMSQRCEEYIVSKARALGLETRAEVECVWQDGYPVPFRVVLQGDSSDVLEQYIVDELGVVSKQISQEEVSP